MPIIDAPVLADVTIIADRGDVLFSPSRNSETGVHDTLLVALSVPGDSGEVEEVGRESDALEAGMERGVIQTKPAAVALRFGSRKSLESFVLAANELVGLARADVPSGDDLTSSRLSDDKLEAQ